MIVLDTNVISELMRSEPSPQVVSWVDRQTAATLYLTMLTLAEIRFAIAVLPVGRRRTTLGTAFEEEIRPKFGDRIITFNEEASRQHATIRSQCREHGVAISDADALIAATVRAQRFEIATRDVSPFEAAGLHVTNPFEGP